MSEWNVIVMNKITVSAKEKFDTSLGITYLVDFNPNIAVGKSVIIDDIEYVVKKIILPTTPNNDSLAIVVCLPSEV